MISVMIFAFGALAGVATTVFLGAMSMVGTSPDTGFQQHLDDCLICGAGYIFCEEGKTLMQEEREPMRNRYMPESEDPIHDAAMTAQILGDQHSLMTTEKPGELVLDPSVEIEQPAPVLRVTAGRFEFIGSRDGNVRVEERLSGSGTYTVLVVPEEWREVITAFAFEASR